MDIDYGMIATIALAIILATLAQEYIIKRRATDKEAALAKTAMANGNSTRAGESDIDAYIRAKYPGA